MEKIITISNLKSRKFGLYSSIQLIVFLLIVASSNLFSQVSVNSVTLCSGATATLRATGVGPFTWAPGGQITKSIVVNPVVTTSYTVTDASDGSSDVSTVTVSGNPPPVLTIPGDTSLCWGEDTDIELASSLGATSQFFVYQTSNKAFGASADTISYPSPTIAQTLTSNPPNVTGIVTYTVIPFDGGCIGTQGTIQVTVLPRPQITGAATPLVICSGSQTQIHLGTTFSPTTITWGAPIQAGTAGATSGSGINNVNVVQTLTSASGGSTTYKFIPSANGCSGDPSTVDVIVNAIPTITNTLSQTVCSGTPSTLVDIQWGDTSVIASAWFEWTADANDNFIEYGTYDTVGVIRDPPTDTEQMDTIPVQTIINKTDVVQTVVYTITVNGCSTPTTDYTIYVEPKPRLINAPGFQTICSGTSSELVDLAVSTPSSFKWFSFVLPLFTGGNVTGVHPGIAPAPWDSIPVQTISTTNLVEDTVVFRVSMASNSFDCKSTDDYAIFVRPLPDVISTPSTDTICSGSSSNISLSTNYFYPGVTYDWTADISGIAMGSAVSGTSNPIAETLTHAGFVLDSVIYSVTATSSDGCVGEVFKDSVYVRPTPDVTTPPAYSLCSDSTTLIELTSNVAGTTFSWTEVHSLNIAGASAGSNDTIQQTLSCSGTTAGTVIYSVTPTADGCPGIPYDITVTIEPVPDVIATPASEIICSDSTTLIELTSNVIGTTYNWTVVQSDSVSGGFGDSNDTIAQTLNNTADTAGFAIYTITPIINGCPGLPIDVRITVEPTPIVLTPMADTICSDSTTNIVLTSNVIGTTFSWTALSSDISISGESDGNGSVIAQALSNSSDTTATVEYTVTPIANACPGAPYTITVTVNPTPDVTALSKTICSGEDANVVLTGTIPGTLFSWVIDTVGVAGASNGNSLTAITHTLITTSTTVGTATYTITPLGAAPDSCPGLPVVVVVTVNPAPLVIADNNGLDAICSGDVTNIDLSSVFVPIPTYTWSVSGNNAIIDGPLSGTTSPITNTLTAIGTTMGSATYTIIPTSAGCPGIPFFDTITVAPIPVGTATPTSETICSGTAMGVSLTADVPGTTFSWNVNQAGGGGVSGGSSGIGTSITHTLTATSAVDGIATYTITPSFAGCNGADLFDTITVQPAAALALQDMAICSGSSPDILLSSAIVGTTFDWVQAASNVSGARDSINVPNNGEIDQVLYTTTNAAGSVTYTVTPVSVSCQGLPSEVTITVNPISDVSVSNSLDSICSGFNTAISLTSSIPGTLFDWTVVPTDITGASDVSDTAGPIAQTLVSTGILAGTAVYSITPKLNGCPGTAKTTTVTVHPVSTATPVTDTVCTGTAPFIRLTSPVAGTTFDWTVFESGVTGAVNMNNTDSINQILSLLAGNSSGFADYTITPSASACPGTPFIVKVRVNSYEDPSFNYTSATFCPAAADPIPVVTGIPGGIFSAIPAGLVFIDVNTGEIDVSLSALNTYTVQYTSPGLCKDSATFKLTISNPPNPNFLYTDTYCKNGTPNPTPFIPVGSSAGVFSEATGGLIFADKFTGEIDLMASTAGSYTVTNSINCVSLFKFSSDVTINPLDNASFNYSSATYCQSGIDPTPTITGATGGTFSVLPAGLVFNSNLTGEIDLDASILGTYTVTYTTSGICPDSSTFGITISNPPIAAFHYAAAYCQNSSPNAIASFNLTPGASGGVFTAASGIVFANIYTGEIDLVASTPGVYMVYNTIPACSGGSVFIDSNTVVITAQDTAAFNYSSATFCQSGVDPVPTITGLVGGTFSAAPAGITFISTSTGEIDLDASFVALNTYTVSYTTTGICPATADFGLSITNVSPPVATFTYGGPYCKNEPNPIAKYTTGSGGVFSSTAGLVFANIYTGEIDLAASTAGVYIVTNTIDCSGLLTTSQYPILINNVVDASFNYEYSTFCQSGTATPTFVATPGGTFSASSSGLVFLSTSVGTINLAASTVGTYTVTYTISGGTCPGSETFVINITNLANPGASFSYDSPFCQSSTPTASPKFPGGSFPGKFTAATGLVFSNPFTGLIDLTASTQGTYMVTNTFDCSGKLIQDSSEVIITTFPNFTVPANTQVCVGDSIITTSFVSIPTYTWVNSNTDIGLAAGGTGNVPGFLGTNGSPSEISGEITVTSTLNGCVGSISTYTITVEPMVTADAGEDVSIISGTSVTLGGNPTGPAGSRYSWLPSSEFVDATYANPSLQPTETTLYTVVVETGGCSSTDSILVTILPYFVPSGGFSPNQDGTNDTWIIDFLDFYPNCSVEIYNRWGMLLYETHNGYTTPWDGTYNGKELPVGTYYYIINLNDPKFPDGITGPITIMR